MPIERNAYPLDFSKHQLERLIALGMEYDKDYGRKVAAAGIVCEPADDTDSVWVLGPVAKTRKQMDALWAETTPYVKALWYRSFYTAATMYLAQILQSCAAAIGEPDPTVTHEFRELGIVSTPPLFRNLGRLKEPKEQPDGHQPQEA